VLSLALLPASIAFCVDGVVLDADTVTLALRTTSATACCPGCSAPSHHVHSRYARTIRDLPYQGRATTLCLTVRKFFCCNPDCPRTIFCERLPDLASRHARSALRLIDSHRAIAFALGGEAGSRLATSLGMPTSADTLLRRIKQTTTTQAPTPRVLGVDDWAIRRGQVYGTILVDLERQKVIDLLPGRDGEALRHWLNDHPGVEIISRDRATAYAQAASEAAPDAMQVADRWHLLKNAREALERSLDRHSGTIRALFSPPALLPDGVAGPADALTAPVVDRAQTTPPPADTALPEATAPAPTARQQQRRERYQEVRWRHGQGQSLRQISREMSLSWRVVRRYVESDRCPDWRPGRAGPSQAGRHRQRVDDWLDAGNRNVADLHRQLTDEGSGLRYDVLRRFVNRRLASRGESRQRANAAAAVSPPPSARQLSFAVLVRAEKRSASQQQQVARLGEVAKVAEAVGLMESFAAMVRKQTDTGLESWQQKATSSGCVEMRRFAQGLSTDQSAVEAALTQPWSNGQVEGQVNRLKTIKRQMFGRAGFELLRRRVLHAG
jgi:transposase